MRRLNNDLGGTAGYADAWRADRTRPLFYRGHLGHRDDDAARVEGGLSRFAGGLQPEEIRSAVLLGLLTFFIYPLLPDRFIDPLDLLNPKQSWLIVVVIAGLGLANDVTPRFYGTRAATTRPSWADSSTAR